MTKWKKELTKKLMAQLTPLYAKIHRPGQIADILIPADGDHFERHMYCAYQSDVIYDDMYGGSHVLNHRDYVSCYYVEGDDEYGAAYVEVATNLKQVVGYLTSTFSLYQLTHLQVGCVNDIGSYICGWSERGS